MTASSSFQAIEVGKETQDENRQNTKQNSSFINGDLNNTSVMRDVELPKRNPAFAYRSLALGPTDDDPVIREKYRPFILPEHVRSTDWTSKLELATVTLMAYEEIRRSKSRLRILILYGSLRKRLASPSLYIGCRRFSHHNCRSYSQLLAFEVARILFRLGCDVRIYNPQGLPIKERCTT
jgi:arsenic resistance protein ArsH